MKNIILTILATTIATTGMVASMEKPCPAGVDVTTSLTTREFPSLGELPDAGVMNKKRKRETDKMPLPDANVMERLGHKKPKTNRSETYITLNNLAALPVDYATTDLLITDNSLPAKNLRSWINGINRAFPQLETLSVEGLPCDKEELLKTEIANQNLNIKVIREAPSIKKARKAHKNATSLPLLIQKLRI